MPNTATRRRLLLASAAVAAVAAVGVALPAQPVQAAHHESAAAAVEHAVASLHPTEGSQTAGMIRFTAEDGGVRVQGEVTGLAPDSTHGFHIHEFGDVSKADGTGTGGHFNPEGHDHALPDEGKPMHAGDMGNLESDGDGTAEIDLLIEGVTLSAGPTCILGRGLIVHAKADDGGQPTGNAGARIAQGVIGVAATPDAKK